MISFTTSLRNTIVILLGLVFIGCSGSDGGTSRRPGQDPDSSKLPSTFVASDFVAWTSVNITESVVPEFVTDSFPGPHVRISARSTIYIERDIVEAGDGVVFMDNCPRFPIYFKKSSNSSVVYESGSSNSKSRRKISLRFFTDQAATIRDERWDDGVYRRTQHDLISTNEAATVPTYGTAVVSTDSEGLASLSGSYTIDCHWEAETRVLKADGTVDTQAIISENKFFSFLTEDGGAITMGVWRRSLSQLGVIQPNKPNLVLGPSFNKVIGDWQYTDTAFMGAVEFQLDDGSSIQVNANFVE
ncbi:Uncharacterised protein [BD1-7 clade bacterium]|uniref:Uncharacterized protein n=1 Tax=BD1-7 clade bacterium TaxID=2029982 RepID=A0A5S9Q645_9GAMM|nr:Uncharacterised protein [BD1-7 clade bacterium]CAA0113339.1 Uncharacterised protein [BD1-7 clade bacterium]